MSKKKLFIVMTLLAISLIPSLTLAKVNLSLKVRGGFNYIRKAEDLNTGSQGSSIMEKTTLIQGTAGRKLGATHRCTLVLI